MVQNNNPPELGKFEFGIVQRKARQIIGRAGYRNSDRNDLEQMLLMRLVQALKSFNSDKAHRHSFVTAVVERAVASILRNARAKKRDHHNTTSLNSAGDTVGNGTSELVNHITDRELSARRGQHPRSQEELAQLASDIAEVMDQLPIELRRFCERLKHASITEISSEMGVPRTTLYGLKRRLLKRFEQSGLRDYL